MPGLIPTHAGKTKPVNNALQGLGAHPHSRGENRGVYRYSEDPEGSSPLTRGKPQTGDQDGDQAGLIPTHAGKTGTMPGAGPFLWAHPHSRGENVMTSCAV